MKIAVVHRYIPVSCMLVIVIACRLSVKCVLLRIPIIFDDERMITNAK